MSITKNNHYVPQWHQEGFFLPDKNTLHYLDLQPQQQTLPDGRVITMNSRFTRPTSRMFVEEHLYSTFFMTLPNDEIERRLFGAIDRKGAPAIKAFVGTDVAEWQRNFEALFEFIDIQKLRTPKGLAWLRARYPSLSQNELMWEMQGLIGLNCTIWSEGVREIVSAEDASVKFIVSDHPITIYNHGIPPGDARCSYPNDPSIALKGSQTIFPLDKNHCLILTNLEYAQDPAANPLEKRTFARNYRSSMVRTDAFIRTRKLTDAEVIGVNHIIKSRARRYIAAGEKDWLYPERLVNLPWSELRTILLPTDNLWEFGGEMYAGYDDGRVYYQDAFGRTEKPNDSLNKSVDESKLRGGDACGCGSGRAYKACCKAKPVSRRPTWGVRGIRERNLFLHRVICEILGFDKGKEWTEIRRDLTDEQVADVYSVYASLWPLETDLLQLLPKPDGTPRAVYTGLIHPETIAEVALGSSLFFGELLIQHRFTNPRAVRDEFNAVKNPAAYRSEFLKAVLFFLMVMPLVELGVVNLFPDPCDFDPHLRDQMMHMAKVRAEGMNFDDEEKGQARQLAEQDFRRGMMALPRDSMRAMLKRAAPDIADDMAEETLDYMERLRLEDPLADLGDLSAPGDEKSGRLSLMRMAPNFEIAMYLAQATGGAIVTDSKFRWQEMLRAVRQPASGAPLALRPLTDAMKAVRTQFPCDIQQLARLAGAKPFTDHAAMLQQTFGYLLSRTTRGIKPNVEAQLPARFTRAHQATQVFTRKAGVATTEARLLGLFPAAGFQDNTVNRLLLMSSSEHHLPSVPMAFYIEREGT